MCELRSRLSAIGFRLSTEHPRQFFLIARSRKPTAAFTLVEMLVAMAITLVMMAAVVTLFANVSNSVRNRRATIEMSGQLRHVRNVLQRDLQGATCPGATWQRPESNHGYIEIIEGQHKEGNASILLDGNPADPGVPPWPNPTWPPTAINPEIDHKLSTIPSSNLPFNAADWITDGAGLGDHDDILMLTVRNEHEPFVGRMPTEVRADEFRADTFDDWKSGALESPLAEVVWYAVENPGYTEDPNDAADGDSDPTANRFFGEPGMRTIYRRTLLIAPWINPYRFPDAQGNVIDSFVLEGESDQFQARPGLVRVLPDGVDEIELEQALAALVAFQERYDLSVRLEFDPNLDAADGGRWVILANTLGDLTKRENRYEHYSFRPGNGAAKTPSRDYPYALVSMGSGYPGSDPDVVCQPDPEAPAPYHKANEEGHAELQDIGALEDTVVAYVVTAPATGNQYKWRPFAYVDEEDSDTLATARVVLNDQGNVVRIVHGLVPLSGERRGEDVMMTGALAFDLRVYDPGAPLFATRQIPGDASSPLDVVLTPSDPGWRGMPPIGAGGAYLHDDNMNPDGSGKIGDSNRTFPFVGQGAYVDMGYGFDGRFNPPLLPIPNANYNTNFASSTPAWFFSPGGINDVWGNLLAPGYCVYDTWSFHYENNGLNEDNDELVKDSNNNDFPQIIPPAGPQGRPQIDEGTDGFDSADSFLTANRQPARAQPPDYTLADAQVSGIDDLGERETVPPYDRPLRGMQVLIRTYEGDSRAIRQVRVNQHFMQE
jgi:type II secretory pathway pseudopilin PulG